MSEQKKSPKSKTEKLYSHNPILSLDEPSVTFLLAEEGKPSNLELDEPLETFNDPAHASTLRMKGAMPPSGKSISSPPPPIAPTERVKHITMPPPPMEKPHSATRKSMPPPPMFTGGGSSRSSIPPLPTPQARRANPPPPVKKETESTGTKTYSALKVTGGLLGQILVDNGFITDEQRDYCLKLQTQSGNFFRIGELAVKQQFISEENLALAVEAQKQYVSNIKKEQSRMIRLPEEVAKAQLGTDDDRSEAMFKKWLASALNHGASDLHVMAGQPLVLRHMGKLIRSKQPSISAQKAAEVLDSILTEADKNTIAEYHSILKCIEIKGVGRARANVFRHMGGTNGTFRLIPPQPPSLVSLNLPSQLAKFTTYSQGLVLITGPIGCGKTTTMAALVDIVNRERRNHIITVERPVEYIHKNARSVVSQREVGLHTQGYANALRAALRQDPDVIVVGEMNDVDTARLAISAAETGHLVFATLHTDNAVRTITRVLDIFPPEEQSQIRSMLSESLRGVVCQRLVLRDSEPGLIPVMELLFTTPAMRNLIRENKVFQLPNAIRMSKDIGNRTFAEYAKDLLLKGEISERTYEQFCREET